MKIKIILFLLSLLFINSCDKNNNETESKQEAISLPKINSQKQLNISILIDLSDRLVQQVIPTAKDRDIAIMQTITQLFSQNMEAKGVFRSKDKIKILFNPVPEDPQINKIAQALNIDLSTLDSKQKKLVHDNIKTSFNSNLDNIYNLTLESRKWVGSDIWRFFKNDVKDYCIDTNPDYRNILVILTDGYIYHEQSKDKIKNRTSFITGGYLEQEGFRNNNNWQKKFENGDYGLISHAQDLKSLEVLILEVNPSASHKNDEDIIKAFLTKWFREMNVLKFQIYNTDLPSNTTQRIVNFFNN